MMERIECRRRIKWFTVCMIREPVSLCTGYGLHSIAVCMGMIAYTIVSMLKRLDLQLHRQYGIIY